MSHRWISKTDMSNIPSTLTKNSPVLSSILDAVGPRRSYHLSPEQTTPSSNTRTLETNRVFSKQKYDRQVELNAVRPVTALYADNGKAPLTKTLMILGLKQDITKHQQHSDSAYTNNIDLLTAKAHSNTSVRRYSTETRNRSCESVPFVCDPKPKPSKPRKPSCRRTKECSKEPNDCCVNAASETEQEADKRESDKVICPKKKSPPPRPRCPPKFKLPLEYCLQRAKRCFTDRPQCEKLEPPVPSFSECLLEFDPVPQMGLAECKMVYATCKKLQPKHPQLGVLKRNVYTPEVELMIDPCVGDCCKLLINKHMCPTKKAGICKMKCKFMGHCLRLQGCDIPDSLECSPTEAKREKCGKRLAPFPSFSECIKAEFPGPAFTEVRVASANEKMYYLLRKKMKPITVETIEKFKDECVRPGVLWNCAGKGTYKCKQATKPLECTKASIELAKAKNEECRIKAEGCNVERFPETARAFT